MPNYFSAGDIVTVRFLEHGGGFAQATPWRVIEERNDRTVLFLKEGSTYSNTLWHREDGRIIDTPPRPPFDAIWGRRDVLRIMYPDLPYSIWLLWDMPQRSLAGWYVNLEDPFVRTGIGFDTRDHELDVVVRPDLSWCWKDEDDLRDIVDAGIITTEKAESIRRAGEGAIARLERRDPPFDEPWTDWTPDPDWGPLKLPEGWQNIPAAKLGT